MLKKEKVSRKYDLWSKFYDHMFTGMFARRQSRAVDELYLKSGDRVLDLGVGTGLTLDAYPSDVQVVGVDLSRGMLDQADKRIQRQGMKNVKLVQCDALRLPFEPASFDHVLISHVITVVPDPNLLLQQAAKMIRPGGRVVIINHFRSTHPIIGALEKVINPLCVHLGWRSDLALADLMERSPLKLHYQFKLKSLDIWKIVVLGYHHKPHTVKTKSQPVIHTSPTSMPAAVGQS